jgi:hypothetical protein
MISEFIFFAISIASPVFQQAVGQ